MGISVNKTLYFDKVPRAKTLQMLVTFAQATYMLDGKKDKIVEKLGAFLDIFKEGGKGSYIGDKNQFHRQYTCGRHLGIWENEQKGSDLVLTQLAKEMVEGKITAEYFLSTVLLNLSEVIENKGIVINPLYSTLNYMKNMDKTSLKKEDINKIEEFALDENESEFRNIWYSLLYSSLFFTNPNKDKEITLNFDLGNIDDFIEACNITLVTKDKSKVDNIKEEYSEQKKYTELLTQKNTWLENVYFNKKNDIIPGKMKNNKSGINMIISGSPGTGKSHYIDEEYYKQSPRTSKRITFHPEYTYNDFVGYIRPVTKRYENNLILHKELVADKKENYSYNSENYITYDFVPGPFTEILCQSLLDTESMHNLIIDEINRANTPAVFGDLFQLLDRDNETHESEYKIHNRDIYEYIKGVFEANNRTLYLNDGEIYIPNNLNIIATMNTADQNVFTMDTAFKRRWEFKYMDIDFKKCDFRKTMIKGLNIEWELFVGIINEFMMSLECSDLMIPEDKQIGPFFIKEKELYDSNTFAYKVLMYLWDDVFKMERERLFNINIRTFSEIVNKFNSNKPFDVFNDNIVKKLKNTSFKVEFSSDNLNQSEDSKEKVGA